MNRKQTKALSEQFYVAAKDYLYLLERGYPQKGIVKLVGNHYLLTAAERVLLFRGIVRRERLITRQKTKTDRMLKKAVLSIDGFNVVRTIGSYLNGNFVFVGMDGFLRDVSELHRKALKGSVLERSLRLIMDYLQPLQPEKITFYFDRPISHSGKMVVLTNSLLRERGLRGEAFAVFSPDHELKQRNDGVICTADSGIIDNAHAPVFDLPAAVLCENFSPQFFSMEGAFRTFQR